MNDIPVIEIKAGSFTINKISHTQERLAMILWGSAGCGKTTIAATARGNKLWLQFDDSGTASIAGLEAKIKRNFPDLDSALKNEIYSIDLSAEMVNYVGKFDQPDAFGITGFLTNPDYNIQTVVVDSLTTLGNDILNYHIRFGGFKGSTLATPGLQAYGARLNYFKSFITNLLKLTKKYNKDIILISHEGAPELNDGGSVTKTTLALGGNLPNETALQVGEVWYMRNSAQNGREIFVTPFMTYTPMKTRMFNIGNAKAASFKFNYDIENPAIDIEIASMFNRWEQGGYEKIELPK